MHSDDEISHLLRLSDKIEKHACKEVLWLLVTTLYQIHCIELRPASQGAFSVLQLRVDGRNCFAFKGAKSHIRFYFRKRAFEDGLVQGDEVVNAFANAERVQQGEIAVNLETFSDAHRLLEFLSPKLHRYS